MHTQTLPVIDWAAVDTVILDMDGTLLDLAYDNYFWRTLVPQRYAALHGLDHAQAEAILRPQFEAVMHTLPWYCTDHWSAVTGLSMADLKREIADRICVLDGATAFLEAIRQRPVSLILATNAHRDSWSLKMAHTGLGRYFDAIVSAHDYGLPKEEQGFWERLCATHHLHPARCFFADDSLPVLESAQRYGIAQVLGLRHPDSTLPPRADFAWTPAVNRLSDLLVQIADHPVAKR
jgi:5'-nucleotidase